MKKLITILLATFFICTASYGATIKELLGGKKSLKLSCVTKKAKLSWYKDDKYKYKDSKNWEGTERITEITEKDFAFDEGSGFYRKKIGINYDGFPFSIDGKSYPEIQEGIISVTDNYYILKSFNYPKSKSKYDFFYIDMKINRYSGKFVFEKQNWSIGLNSIEEGTCSKVKDKQF